METIGTGCDESRCACLLHLLNPQGIDSLAFPGVHPEMTAAPAAAAADFPVIFHFNKFGIDRGVYNLPWRIKYFLVPSEITRVMVYTCARVQVFRLFQLPSLKQVPEKFAVVNDIEPPSELRILVFEYIVTVRTGHQECFEVPAV